MVFSHLEGATTMVSLLLIMLAQYEKVEFAHTIALACDINFKVSAGDRLLLFT
jgi:hypothetical protein